MATPAWLAADAGQPTNAGQINQFLGTHAGTIVYTGVVQSQQNTVGTGSSSSNGLYLAQSFTTGASQTTIGRVVLTLDKTGAPTPLSVSIQATSSGSPSGTPLVTTLMPNDFLGTSSGTFSIPTPVTGLTPATQYWVVWNAVGDVSNFFSWFKSNQVTGAKTSANGTTWTAQTFGYLYQVVDNTGVQPVVHTWDDNSARWSIMLYNGLNQIVTLGEYNAGQTTTGYLLSVRSLAYTAGLLTSIT